MRQLILTLFLLSITGFLRCNAGVPTLDTIGQLLPELESVFKMLKTETSTTIANPVYPSGFTRLHTGMDHTRGAVKRQNLPALFNIWLQDVSESPQSRKQIRDFIHIYVLQEDSEPFEKTIFQFSFDDGHGTLYF